MYAYMLCTKRFVVIFVLIVWKTTLNTLEKLERDYLRELFEGNHWRRIIWGGSFEGKGQRKKIFDKRRRDGILRQTARILRISINKTRLFAHVWYLSSLNILSRSSYQIFLLAVSLKWSSSNNLSQMIFFE